MTSILLLLGVAGAADLVDRIAAVVDDQPLALSEVYDLGGTFVNERCPGGSPTDPAHVKCVREAELEILDALIKRELIRAELAELDIAVGGTDVDQAIDRIVAQYQMQDRQALRAEVEAQGMRWDTYRDQIAEQLATQRFQARILAPRVSITDDELLAVYQKSTGSTEALEVKLQALGISIPMTATPEQIAAMEQQAATVVADLNADRLAWPDAIRDFDAAHLADVFGTRTWREGQLIPQLDKLAFSAPLGEAQPPVRINNLIVVFEVGSREVGKSTATGPAFEEVKGKIQEQVFALKLADAEEEWYQIARRQASVQILLESL